MILSQREGSTGGSSLVHVQFPGPLLFPLGDSTEQFISKHMPSGAALQKQVQADISLHDDLPDSKQFVLQPNVNAGKNIPPGALPAFTALLATNKQKDSPVSGSDTAPWRHFAGGYGTLRWSGQALLSRLHIPPAAVMGHIPNYPTFKRWHLV